MICKGSKRTISTSDEVQLNINCLMVSESNFGCGFGCLMVSSLTLAGVPTRTLVPKGWIVRFHIV